MDLLTDQQITHFIEHHQGWSIDKTAAVLVKEFTFRDFNEAFSFMTNVALHAEKKNHHPEWTNIYNNVSVRLSTHDAKGVTEQDTELAKYMDNASGADKS